MRVSWVIPLVALLALGCGTFVRTPALPGESQAPTESEPQIAHADTPPEETPEAAEAPTNPAEPTKKKKRRRRRANRSKGWSVEGQYTTVSPSSFAAAHLGRPHDETFAPIGDKNLFPGRVERTDVSRSDSTFGGKSDEWGLEGELSLAFLNASVGYADEESSAYATSYVQTHCIAAPNRGMLRKDRRIPKEARYIPFEVCYGYAVSYRVSLSSANFRAGAGFDEDSLASVGGIAGFLASVAGDLVGFEGSLKGFKKSREVSVDTKSWGFSLSESGCSADRFIRPDALLQCLDTSKESETPILVRWRELSYDEWGAASGKKSHRCLEHQVTGYHYDPASGVSGPLLINMRTDEGHGGTLKTSDGTGTVRFNVERGSEVGYTVRRLGRGKGPPPLVEEGSITIPVGHHEGAVASGSGRMKVRAHCVR